LSVAVTMQITGGLHVLQSNLVTMLYWLA